MELGSSNPTVITSELEFSTVSKSKKNFNFNAEEVIHVSSNIHANIKNRIRILIE